MSLISIFLASIYYITSLIDVEINYLLAFIVNTPARMILKFKGFSEIPSLHFEILRHTLSSSTEVVIVDMIYLLLFGFLLILSQL